jgi:hypothetical protein
MRKTLRSKGRNAEFYVIGISQAPEQPARFYSGEALPAKQSENFRSLLYADFPELLQQVDSLHVTRQWDHHNSPDEASTS